ncbi:hypothetical protein B0H67DRAFT_580167 [Lasiosphaeris hirsuta]|uniref:ATPase synthesis protein 25 n=1 Tax=Lasiosphaeris hirsuta TaxID=260670 RepID=A0AA40DT52_9PEZI|nr:hypothetical protein B0H67DRAFT_580167 [Lasiosphaeris hirsuta]
MGPARKRLWPESRTVFFLSSSAAARIEYQVHLSPRTYTTSTPREQSLTMSAAPALRAASCSGCRSSALWLIIGNFAGVRVPQLSLRARPFAPAARYSTFRPTARLNQGFAIEERIPEKDENGQPVETGANGSDVPWYLEVEAPRHPTLLTEPTPLPDVPEGSPKLMGPLVKFASDELGLDQLEMLDLRELDPPAGLGPNLIMLFGSARSERHLHVSADRLTRWLRGYGVTAVADGLLGRNELKIKLRRKARKAKLLGTTGLPRGADDGISTGWICINLGTIGSSDVEMEILDEAGLPTGFGVAQTGTTIVVQVMTEARRQELDLEKLWKGMLRRGLEKKDAPVRIQGHKRERYNDEGKKQKRDRRHDPDPDHDPDPVLKDGFEGFEEFGTIKPFNRGANKGRPGRSKPPAAQFYSTLARQSFDAPIDVSHISQTPLAKFASSNYSRQEAIEKLSDILAHDTESKIDLLNQLKTYSESLCHDEAQKELSAGDDGTPPRFLRLFDRAIENLPDAKACEFRLWLQIYGQKFSHDHFNVSRLQKAFQEVQLHSIPLIRDEYLYVLSAIFRKPGGDDAAVRQQSAFAVEVVDAMFTRGEKVLDPDIIATVIQSLVKGGCGTPESARLLTQFEYLLFQPSIPCPSEDTLIQLLDLYFTVKDWDRFWTIWRIPPRYGRARSAKMYAHLYQYLANSNSQTVCADALRWCVSEMVYEQPPIRPAGKLLKDLKACIRIADPSAEPLATSLVPGDRSTEKLAMREFVKLWQRLPSY